MIKATGNKPVAFLVGEKRMAAAGKKKTKKGQQKPTASLILKYTKTFGQDAIDLYDRTGRTAQEWQERLMKAILAQNREGLWVHTKFGYSVPRRNGKMR